VKCKDCRFYKSNDLSDPDGKNPDTKWDCINPKIRGESGLIHLVYCEGFFIDPDFGCIYAEARSTSKSTPSVMPW